MGVSMPHRLGRYAVRRRIGSGGFATVWLAYDEQLDSPVAIKVLADNWTEDHQIRQRFLEEGRYLRKVESPHVVSVYDAGELDDGRPYLVMSYADQGTLADRLDVEGLTTAQAMEVVRQVGTGLQALHDRDILHRDIKPANVLFRSVDRAEANGVRAMVGDLGLGKSLDMSSRLTMIAGTPTYVAPEQAAAQAPDARADQYSLAALAFLLLTGRPPFTHLSLSDAMNPGDLPPVSTPDRPFPPALEQVLHRGLARDRDDRYPTVTGFVDALERGAGADRVRSGDPAVARRPTPSSPSPVRARPCSPARATCPSRPCRADAAGGSQCSMLVGLLALAVGGGAGYAAQRGLAPTERTVADDNGTLSGDCPGRLGPCRRHPGMGAAQRRRTAVRRRSRSAPAATGRPASRTRKVSSLALLPGTGVPSQLPQHEECGTPGRVVRDTQDGNESATTVYSDCPGGGIVVERTVLVFSDTLLWVQVRSADRATANQVLDDVETHGIWAFRTRLVTSLRAPASIGRIVAAVRLTRSRSPSWSPVAAGRRRRMT